MDAWVISLPSRPDRAKAFDARAKQAGLDYRVQPGVIATERGDWEGSMSSYGCALAHRQILWRCDDDVLIFEDDAQISATSMQYFYDATESLPPDWEIVVLGGYDYHYNGDDYPMLRGLSWWHTTHAYMVSESALHRVLAINEHATTHWDHDLGSIMGARGHSYAVDIAVLQDESLGSDVQ